VACQPIPVVAGDEVQWGAVRELAQEEGGLDLGYGEVRVSPTAMGDGGASWAEVDPGESRWWSRWPAQGSGWSASLTWSQW
jgi:hypothetical protein